MSHYVVYDKASGKILVTGYCTDGSEKLQGENVLVVEEAIQSVDTHYIDNEKLCSRPVAPSDFHKWDFDKKTWEPDRDRLIAVLKNTETERFNRGLREPVKVDEGLSFDVSEPSISAIQQRLQASSSGICLPDDFVWKDATNVYHPCDIELLKSILREYLSRDFLLRQAFWENKARIEAMTFEEALEALSGLER